MENRPDERLVFLSTDMPTLTSRAARFEALGFGLFVHWGLYSQLERGEWVQSFENIPSEQYLRLMDTFTAADFDALALVRQAKRAGMTYVTLTSRHHEGFSLYDTKGLSKLDVTHTPCRRDLVMEFVEACRSEDVVPMLYCTTIDWNDERFESDWDAYLQYLRESVEVLCTSYGEIGGFWFDGNWANPEADWKEDELYSVIRRHQPEAMIINNTGVFALGQQGHPEIDGVTFERSRPVPVESPFIEKHIVGEMCHTMNFHWGTARRDFNLLSPAHIIRELCFARRAGANLLMNVGPGPQGQFPDYEAACLNKVGEWLELFGGNSGVMYRGKPCGIQGDHDDFGLSMDDVVYLFVTDITPTSDTQYHGTTQRGPGARTFTNVPPEYSKASWIDNGEVLETHFKSDGTMTLMATSYPYGTDTVVRIAKLTR